MTAYVIGNGESRAGIDLAELEGDTYGSNALHRDFHPDNLVCCDKRMVHEALDGEYLGPIYTRPDWVDEFSHLMNVHELPAFTWPETEKWEQHFHCGSGLHSVWLALTDGQEHISLLGFDLFSTDGLHNNIYKDTNNYESSNYNAVDPSHWIPQFERMFTTYPDVHFDYLVPEFPGMGWRTPKQWHNCRNLHLHTRVL